ncbi:MAG: hypothetical protein ACYDHH_05145 [Solirubrobacteraceae bacterium]
MSEQPPSQVLGALPRSRPHRRSDKRPAKPAVVQTAPLAIASEPSTKPKRAAQPKPAAKTKPAQGRVAAQKAAKPDPPTVRTDVLGTAVQAAAELAEIGISATARALRGAVGRLPRP